MTAAIIILVLLLAYWFMSTDDEPGVEIGVLLGYVEDPQQKGK